MEAVKQGSICLGLRSSEFVVLCSLKKLPSELACYQDKIFKVEDNIGMAISGLTADARVLCKYMRNESLNYKLTYGSNQPLNRLIFKIADSNSPPTQSPKSRPSTPPKGPTASDCSSPASTRTARTSSRPAPVEITMNTRPTPSGRGRSRRGPTSRTTWLSSPLPLSTS